MRNRKGWSLSPLFTWDVFILKGLSEDWPLSLVETPYPPSFCTNIKRKDLRNERFVNC